MDHGDAEQHNENAVSQNGNTIPADNTQTTQEHESVQPKSTAPQHTEKPQKGGFLKKCAVFFLILLCLILVPVAGLVLYSLIDRENPARHIAGNFYTLVTVSSASEIVQKGLYLSAADSLLSAPETAALQGNVRALRSNAVLQSVWFKRLLNIPVNAAFYEKNAVALVSDIGIRSAATRLLPLMLRIRPELIDGIQGLSQTAFALDGKTVQGFVFALSKDQSLYLCFYKNLLIAATSHELFQACLSKNTDETGQKLTALLRDRSGDAINIYADPSYFTAGIAQQKNVIGNMMRELSFPELSKQSITFDDEHIGLRSSSQWVAERAEVQAVLNRRSNLPGVLSRLPESAVYLTLFNLGDPDFLYSNTQPFFTPELTRLFNTAEKNCKLFFHKDLNQLVFEWVGSEIGVFGHKDAQNPVFFVSVKDEAKCRRLLEDLFDTIFLDRSTAAVIDGDRIPRIVLPAWLAGLLKAFSIDLPQPFYMIQDGYLYLSKSAEALGMCKKEIDDGKLLIKTKQWKTYAKSISPETSFLVYYSLERSIPFFLQQNAALKAAFKNYGQGVLSLRFAAGQQIYLDFYTQKTASRSLEEIPSFPRMMETQPETGFICAQTAARIPYGFWTNGSNVYRMNLLTGETFSLALDGSAGISADFKNTGSGPVLQALWAVSARGSIYKTDEHLEPFDGFPVLTAHKLQPKPAALNGVIVPLFSEPALLRTDQDGAYALSDEMESKLRGAPIVFKNMIAALPRSFESKLYIFNRDGRIAEGLPVELDGIFAAEPLMFTQKDGKDCVALVNEEGRFSIRSLSEDCAELTAAELYAVCKTTPAYSYTARAFFVVSADGRLFKISDTGEVIDSLPLKTGKADDYTVCTLDLDRDGNDEVLVSGGGNAVYAYTSGLAPVDGFPIAGTGRPYLFDIDGDKAPELITYGVDRKLHAYRGAALR